ARHELEPERPARITLDDAWCTRSQDDSAHGRRWIGQHLHDRRARTHVDDSADEAVGRDHRAQAWDVVAAAAIYRERPDPAAPLAPDDLAGERRERELFLQAEETAQALVLDIGVVDAQRADPQLLHFLAQPVVLGAHVLPVEVGGPEAERRAARAGKPGLDRRSHHREGVASSRAVAARLER